MNQIFLLLIFFSGFVQAQTPISVAKPDSATSLSQVKESYKLSGVHLTALAEKVLYKKTPQENLEQHFIQ